MSHYLTPEQDDFNQELQVCLPEYVNACYPVAKLVCCGWQVLEDAPAWKNNH